jgi:hypothetical protein
MALKTLQDKAEALAAEYLERVRMHDELTGACADLRRERAKDIRDLHEATANTLTALLARAEAAEGKIENAGQAMAETQPSWEYRCHAITAALGMDFGGPTPDGIPEEHTWYSHNLKRANSERDAAVLKSHQYKAERDAAFAEVARLSTPPDDAEVAALSAFHDWSNNHAADWKMGALKMNGKFSRFMDPDTDTAWIGFKAGFLVALARLSHALAAERKLADDAVHELKHARAVLRHEQYLDDPGREAVIARHAARRKEETLVKHGSKT